MFHRDNIREGETGGDMKITFGTGKHNFGYIPEPPEPPSDEWFEEHCPRCKWNREWFDGEWHGECLQGGCTGFEESEDKE